MSTKRTAEEVCIEYASANASVSRLTATMNANPCEALKERLQEYGAAIESRPGIAEFLSIPSSDTCLNRHWRIELRDNYGREEPEIPYDEMCDACKVRSEAVQARKEARSRLGAAKRSIGAIGKRLAKEVVRSEA